MAFGHLGFPSVLRWVLINTVVRLFGRFSGSALFYSGQIMDVKAYAALKKKAAKDPKKKDGPSQQKPVDEFFKKGEAPQTQGREEPSGNAAPVVTGVNAGSSQAEELKRKRSGKGVSLPEKKQKKVEIAPGKDAPLVVVDDQPSSPEPQMGWVTTLRSPADPETTWPREEVHFPLKKGNAVMLGSLDPLEFMRGVIPSKDRLVLSKYEDDVLDCRIMQASVTATMALGEQLRRVDRLRVQKAQADLALKKAVEENASFRKKMTEMEAALRAAEEGMEQRLKEAEAKGKTTAEEAASAAAKLAAEAAEVAKKEAIAEAGKAAVDSFVTEGWKAEGRKQWLASVIEQSVDAWVAGPGAEWLARKGKDYYDGGEFFTQRLVYRRLARHLKIEAKEFDPASYGLPPLQPDVRVPPPPGRREARPRGF
ncbi:unnamed protein product [Cuscuta epithymum]|uniref:Uncharacterized protein n=1 Tax=Cuscuta epithymum TaxID=186058 RepID=A0AAV0DF35_9ASTE|nr:unnamed protein product [Cuscuta epithymum]CAH9138343.1 unnamed protein product [Cuscuta epithymum]